MDAEEDVGHGAPLPHCSSNCRHRVHRQQSAASHSACEEAPGCRRMVFRVLRRV